MTGGGAAAGGASGGTSGGGAGGGTSGGGTSGGGAGGGTSGGGTSGGGVAGGTSGGGTGGGASGGDPSSAGCSQSDAGLRCHPLCTPGPALAVIALDQPCCLDDECASGQCFGEGSNRSCAPAVMRSMAGGDCADMSDCQPELACDIESRECAASLPTTFGGGSCTVVGPSNPGLCTITPMASCALPGVVRSQGGNPCCYDRSDAGVRTSCLDAGTCYEFPLGSGMFGSYAGGVCPL
ncbi:MAG: hypothetical protein SFW67_24070 [Myxococcaceae bacterium]|nr:hypothetical protein [Myxococcaceae bacterium]